MDLSRTRLDFIRTNVLDAAVARAFPRGPAGLGTKPIRLAVLGTSTTAHLQPGIRMGALRRGLWVTTYEPEYGQYLQDLLDPSSGLHRFEPNAILFALDSDTLTAGFEPSMTAAEADAAFDLTVQRIEQSWALAQDAFRSPIMMQTPMPVFPSLMGSNEHRLPGSRSNALIRLNVRLRSMADQAGVDLVALDDHVASDGLDGWHDAALWHRAKQEVTPAATPVYGDLVARVLAAYQGRSAKCLVLDLDNTIWGGVVGDDGTDKLVLGQGSALGEAFVGVQRYAKNLAQRGVILAVCSKNDEANALEPFERHPDMILRRADIACFVANWTDKAANLRTIAERLNIGVDSLVFLDDNPFERNLVRAALPEVAVPEVPDDPALIPRCLAAAGYFESLSITADDRARTAQYRDNEDRKAILASATDLPSYLRGLDMRLLWGPFDPVGLPRIVQLVNKTNQFNLTTRRITADEAKAVMGEPTSVGLQIRLLDRFGDNGMIAVVIGHLRGRDLVIETWLMSCRVLGRGVEDATLDLVVGEAKRLGATRIVGEYRPSAKNGMVRDHYRKLGFTANREDDDAAWWTLALADRQRRETFMSVERSTSPDSVQNAGDSPA